MREEGFTLIEMLVAVAILSILAALSWGAYLTYKMDAEYSKAEALIKIAQTSISLGDIEAQPGEVYGYLESGTEGGMLPDEMQEYLPGAITPKEVMLGAILEGCVDSSPALNMFLIARPCNSDKEVTWAAFCDGTQVYSPNLGGGGC